jgi:ribonuclease HI
VAGQTLVAAADGSSLSNPGPAGWAWFIDPASWAAGGWPHGTNNMGELMAVLNLLRQTSRLTVPLHVLSDSQYTINVCTTWLPGWKARGWRKADHKPILNLDLVQALDVELQDRRVTFEWVKGHAGHPLNERADQLARAAAEAFQRGAQPNTGPGLT